MAGSTTTSRPSSRPPTRAQVRARGMRRVRLARRVTQLFFVGLILVVAIRHQVDTAPGQPSVDAVCPFGGFETLITWVTTGSFISKTHPSNLVLMGAIVVATLLVGNTFCGWVCPFGAIQDAQTWLRRKLKLPAVELPGQVDRVLRWGRFLVLALVLYLSVTTARLWFADHDPYVQLFGLHWLFEPDPTVMWVGWTITVVVLLLTFVIERAWCRYLCPLGAVFSVLGVFSVFRIRRSATTCTDCTVCDKPCPVHIEPSKAKPFVSTDCIGCMDCVAACPVKNSLKVEGPVLLGIPLVREAAPAEGTRRERVGAGARRTVGSGRGGGTSGRRVESGGAGAEAGVRTPSEADAGVRTPTTSDEEK